MFVSTSWTTDYFGILYLKQFMNQLKRSEIFFLILKTLIIVAFKYKLQADDFSFLVTFRAVNKCLVIFPYTEQNVHNVFHKLSACIR